MILDPLDSLKIFHKTVYKTVLPWYYININY
ncbi:hypothetical protein [Shigella phage ESh25]|nr:hypothetical protein [Shigella phage ESh25]